MSELDEYGIEHLRDFLDLRQNLLFCCISHEYSFCMCLSDVSLPEEVRVSMKRGDRKEERKLYTSHFLCIGECVYA